MPSEIHVLNKIVRGSIRNSSEALITKIFMWKEINEIF